MRTLKLASICVFLLLTTSHAFGLTKEQSVALVLDNFHQAAAEADGQSYFALLSQDSVFIGTDASERWNKAQFQAFAEPYFSVGKGWTYLPRDRHISFSKDAKVAWFDEMLDSKSYGECRGTGVLIKEGDSWLISQYHLVFPVPNALAKDVVKKIAEHKRNTQP